MGFNEKQERMFAMVREWETGSESLKWVAARHGIPTERLMYWKRKYRQKGQSQGTGFIQLSPPGSLGLTLRYPNGVVLTLPTAVSSSLLKELIRLAVD